MPNVNVEMTTDEMRTLAFALRTEIARAKAAYNRNMERAHALMAAYHDEEAAGVVTPATQAEAREAEKDANFFLRDATCWELLQQRLMNEADAWEREYRRSTGVEKDEEYAGLGALFD